MSKVRVLHVTQASIGGTAEYIKLFFKNIDREKFELILVCPSYGSLKEDIENMGFKVHVIEMQRNINIFQDYKCYLKLKLLMKNLNVNIVHCHSSKGGVLGRIAARSNNIPSIYNPHGWSFSMNVGEKKKMAYALIEKMCSKYTTKIINISDYEQSLALEYNIAPRDKMVTIYNGIDVQAYSENVDRNKMLKKLSIPKDAYIIGMVARLTDSKSPETFLEVAEVLSKKIGNSYFLLVGDGELRDKIENLISSKKLNDRIKITGWVSDVNKYISIFDVGILTSKWEGFGLVLAEYMAAGKPVVASWVGGIPNVIKDNYNGKLIKSLQPSEFVDAIIKIKNNKEIREKFITNATKTVNRDFKIDRVVKEHEKLYYDLIGLGGKYE